MRLTICLQNRVRPMVSVATEGSGVEPRARPGAAPSARGSTSPLRGYAHHDTGEEELERLADVYGVGITAFFGGRITPKEYLFGG